MTSTTAERSPPIPPTELVRQLRKARRIAVLTGAGMSAESGIPTFRDAPTGMWSTFDQRSLATPQGFMRDPDLVWGWYESRRHDVSRARPNAGHVALREIATLPWIEDLTIVAQNVDDLHERAGSCPVHHLHGNLFASRCFACGRPHATTGPAADENTGAARAAPPRCAHCGGLIRPGVVWFGEMLPDIPWKLALACIERADLMLVVGTSGQVHPAALLPATARRMGCDVWEINPDEDSREGTVQLWATTAAGGLPLLLAVLAS